MNTSDLQDLATSSSSFSTFCSSSVVLRFVFWAIDSPIAGISRHVLLLEDISPKLNPRFGRPGCLCPTSRSKPFRLGRAYCRRHSSLPCITSQKFTVYFVVDTPLHNCTSDLRPEVAHLNVPEADCPYCSFPQSV
jgi:hypothetical protein